MDEPSGKVRREGNDQPKVIASRGGSVRAGLETCRSAHAESDAAWRCRCVADVRDASNSERPCRASSRNEKSPSTVDHGIHRPSVVRPACGWAMCRPPSSSLIALSAASSGLRRRRSAATVPTVPVLGASCRCPDGSGMKRPTKPEAVVEGWRLIATDDELKNTRAPVTVSSELIHSSYFSPVESARNLTRFGERKHHATYGECYLICRPTSGRPQPPRARRRDEAAPSPVAARPWNVPQ